ncbi:DUF3313 family protein [Parvularcula lutaonensis]|uniref:DUF3313 family protein n=1 Tax=Parvularcula lutaonensis TaxID=491923 RepID=A0ABV7MA86_9PROT|nr:DUF3313 family protein [Parvularcula lutaonensis]GGY44251.1 hypothetical protein GCM10007148_11430 [Parvularcula lutaonensis]
MRMLFLSAAALALAACASGPTGPDAAARFDTFQAIQTNDFRAYDKVQVLKPVPGPDVASRIDARTVGRRFDRRPISQQDVDAKMNDLYEDLVRELSRHAEIVDESGPGIITVRTIVTDLDANRPTMAELTDNPGLSLQSIAAGDAAVRIELIEDGQVLAVITDSDNVNNLGDPRLAGVAIWETADRFFEQVARKLGDLFAG